MSDLTKEELSGIIESLGGIEIVEQSQSETARMALEILESRALIVALRDAYAELDATLDEVTAQRDALLGTTTTHVPSNVFLTIGDVRWMYLLLSPGSPTIPPFATHAYWVDPTQTIPIALLECLGPECPGWKITESRAELSYELSIGVYSLLVFWEAL